jgi:hypothetical protein
VFVGGGVWSRCNRLCNKPSPVVIKPHTSGGAGGGGAGCMEGGGSWVREWGFAVPLYTVVSEQWERAVIALWGVECACRH